VILAVVVIVAVVVATLMGDLISLVGETSDRSSKLYWKNAEIGLMDWIIGDGEDALVVRNNQEYDIYIHNITLDGNTESLNASIRTGEQKTLKADWIDCDSDESYGYFVTFVYDNTEFNLTGKSFTGGEKVVGTCQ
jgi:hypothetical protein